MNAELRRAIEWDIARLITRYANLNDRQQWHDVAATYVEDGEMIRPSAPGRPLIGRAAILEAFQSRSGGRITKHVCSNVEVSVVSDVEATAYSAYLIYSGARQPDDPLPLLDPKPPTLCEFHDRLVRTPEGWRFRRREGVILFRTA